MPKKTPTYYHDQLIIYSDQFQAINGDVATLESFMLKAIQQIMGALNQASASGVIDALVDRYIAGDSFLTTNTQAARDEYAKIFIPSVLPATHTRRWLDIAARKIKDVIKEEATKKRTAQYIVDYPEFDDGGIAKKIYEDKKNGLLHKGMRCPKAYDVKKIRAALAKQSNAPWVSTPSFEAKLSLSQADQISSVSRVRGGGLEFSVGLGGTRQSKYYYELPVNDERFVTGKLCKPDVMLDDNGRVYFVFAVRHKAPLPFEPQCDVPVDLGVLYPFTACAMSKNARSQVFYPDEKIMKWVRYIDDRSTEKAALLNDIEENQRAGRSERLREKAARQLVEVDRLAACITRAKCRVADLVAHRVCEIAYQLRGRIVLEKLSWSEPSHMFFYSLLTENIECLALRCGIPFTRVSAAGSSRDCPSCGEKLVQGKDISSPTTVPSRGEVQCPVVSYRGVECPSCGLRGHHDGVSPYNLGCRGLGCLLPSRFVRVRLKKLCWRDLPPGWRRAPQRSLRPFEFDFQVSASSRVSRE